MTELPAEAYRQGRVLYEAHIKKKKEWIVKFNGAPLSCNEPNFFTWDELNPMEREAFAFAATALLVDLGFTIATG
jgi:hypothetical protein